MCGYLLTLLGGSSQEENGQWHDSFTSNRCRWQHTGLFSIQGGPSFWCKFVFRMWSAWASFKLLAWPFYTLCTTPPSPKQLLPVLSRTCAVIWTIMRFWLQFNKLNTEHIQFTTTYLQCQVQQPCSSITSSSPMSNSPPSITPFKRVLSILW